MVELELIWSGAGSKVQVAGEFTEWQPRQPIRRLLQEHIQLKPTEGAHSTNQNQPRTEKDHAANQRTF